MFRKFFIVLIIFVFFTMISACSKTVEKGSEKGEIDKITQKVAEDALHAIKDPIEQAKAVEGIVADRESSFEKNLGKEE